MRSAKGNLLICVSTSTKGFPDCSKDESARRLVVAGADAKSIKVNDLRPGIYAISMIHDENGNGKMDMRLFLPREGFGFSNNPSISFGPPKFRSAQFEVKAGANTQSVKLKYML